MDIRLSNMVKTTSIRKIIELISARGLGVVLQVLMQFTIARLGGPAALGLLQIYQTWSCVLGEVTAMGLPTQTMKSVAIESQGRAVIVRLYRSLKCIFVAWLAVAVLLLILGWLLPGFMVLSFGNQVALAWSVFCFASLRICAEALKAMNASGEAVFAENAIVPLLILLLSGLMLFFGVDSSQQILGVFSLGEMLIYSATLFLTIASLFSLDRCFKRAADNVLTTRRHQRETAKDSGLFSSETRFFWGTAILSIAFLNMPFLLMPWFGSVEAVGLFTLAFKFINPITTILIMLGAFFGPRFAQAFTGKDSHRNLAALLRQTQLISIALYLPALLPILFFAEPILALFGNEFREAKNYLFILAAAQLVNALTGLSGNMLNMVGHGRVEFYSSLIFTLFALVSGIWAGVTYGLAAVAVSYGVALAGKNLCSYFFALRFLSCTERKTPTNKVHKASLRCNKVAIQQ